MEWSADEKTPYLVYWGEELSLAFQSLGLTYLRVTHRIIYNKRENILEKYMSNFFNIKKKHDDGPMRAIAKLFGNSLYGKMG